MNTWTVNLANNSSSDMTFNRNMGNGTIDPAPPTVLAAGKNFLCTVTTGNSSEDSVGVVFREDQNGTSVGFEIGFGITVRYQVWTRGEFELKDSTLNITYKP